MLVGQLWLFMPMLFNFPALGSTSAIVWRHWQWRRIMIERFFHSTGARPVVKINHGKDIQRSNGIQKENACSETGI